jgi:hypothetical protein
MHLILYRQLQSHSACIPGCIAYSQRMYCTREDQLLSVRNLQEFLNMVVVYFHQNSRQQTGAWVQEGNKQGSLSLCDTVVRLVRSLWDIDVYLMDFWPSRIVTLYTCYNLESKKQIPKKGKNSSLKTCAIASSLLVHSLLQCEGACNLLALFLWTPCAPWEGWRNDEIVNCACSLPDEAGRYSVRGHHWLPKQTATGAQPLLLVFPAVDLNICVVFIHMNIFVQTF